MGDIIDSNSSPYRGCWRGLYISERDKISFCKIAYADNAIDCLWQAGAWGKIENNIITNFGESGISGLIDYSAYGTYAIKNNLIVNDSMDETFAIFFTWDNLFDADLQISNNTFARNIFDVYCEGASVGGSIEIFNNLFTDSDVSNIYWEEILNVQISYNGFFDSPPAGSNYVICASSPFDSDETSLGSYFLNNLTARGAALLDAGLGDVEDYYDNPKDWSIHNIPDDDKHFFDSETNLAQDTVWYPDYSRCDNGPVAIGYHYPRVDYCIKEHVSVAPGKKLEIEPGTVISLGSDLGSADSQIKCRAELNNNIYIVDPQSASSNWIVPEQAGFFDSSYAGNYEFIKFFKLDEIILPANSSISNCTFKSLTDGLSTNNSTVLNNIFSYCRVGINLGNNVDLKNNIFDRCGIACALGIAGGNNCSLTNNIFRCSGRAIDDCENTPENFIENFNAFIANNCEHIRNDEQIIPLGQDSLSFSQDSQLYYWQDFADRFYLSPDSLLINAGNPSDGPMSGYTSDPLAFAIDNDRRNIGYHYPVQKEYWLKPSSQTTGTGTQTNPFTSISQIQTSASCTWDIIHIITGNVSDSNLALLFENKTWPPRQYRTSAVYRNCIRWNFDNEYRIGQFCNGDFWVSAPVKIISVTPAPSGSGVTFRNGSMLNPLGNLYHAYDGRVEGFSSSQILNYPLTLEGSNSLISSASIISQPTTCTCGYLDVTDYCVRYNYQGDFHSYLYSAAVLTTLPYIPPANLFRPPYAGSEKPFFDKNSLRTDLLPALPLETKPNTTYLNKITKEFQNTWLDHKNNSSVRMIHPVRNMPNYGREIGTAVGEGSCLLMLDYSREQLTPLLIGFVQVGIDLYYNRLNGTAWGGDAGHDNGRKWPIIFAGLMLDNSGMKNIAQTHDLLGSEDLQTYYNPSQKALWGRNCVSSYTEICDGNSARDCRKADQLTDGCPSYRNCCTSNTWIGEAVAITLMAAEDLWSHDEFFDYVHRWVTADVPGGGEIMGGSYIRDMWNSFWPGGITIIDNGQTGSTSVTGSWTFSSSLNPYSTGSFSGANGATYTWTFKPQDSGSYNVSMWWTAMSSRGSAIPVTVQHSAGTENLIINQQQNGGQWFSLGDFAMNAGSTYKVIITAPGSPLTTCADAVKFQYIQNPNVSPTASIISISPNPALPGEMISFSGAGEDTDGTITGYNWHSNIDGLLSTQSSFDSNALSQGIHTISFTVCDNNGQWSQPATQSIFVGQFTSETIIDNGDPQTSSIGTWAISSALDPYGSNSVWSYSGATYTWKFIPVVTAVYKVSMWWTALSSRSSAVPVTIQNSGETNYVTINQQQNGGQWNELGQYPMDAGTQYKIIVTAPTGSPPSTCADAVRFEIVSLEKKVNVASSNKSTYKKSLPKKSRGFLNFKF
jgi:hypothetical protein